MYIKRNKTRLNFINTYYKQLENVKKINVVNIIYYINKFKKTKI